jgi:hypothetical protein
VGQAELPYHLTPVLATNIKLHSSNLDVLSAQQQPVMHRHRTMQHTCHVNNIIVLDLQHRKQAAARQSAMPVKLPNHHPLLLLLLEAAVVVVAAMPLADI